MSAQLALALTLALPFGGALAVALLRRRPNWRETASLVTALALFAVVLHLIDLVGAGLRPSLTLAQTLPGLALRLELEPLGATFAGVASCLWIASALYSIGYMRGNRERHQTRFYVCFAIAIASTMGVAAAGNMFTLFLFYELLTLSTYPLVTHKGTPEARRAGRLYLGLLLGTSIGFQLLAIIGTWVVAGTLDFRPGGVLAGRADGPLAAVLLALYAFGIGKAALMPFHRWLPAAMVAPTPVSALLHAVAVVKAGVFTLLKVVVYLFGADFLRETGASEWLVWVAAATLLIASVVALGKDNLKARLAYSTVSQLAYVVLGAALATSAGVLGGAFQIAMHAFGKITLFFCAGAIYTATHKTEISDMDGLGRRMPVTYAAFLIGALSIIGLPPLGGSWSKWYLMLGAAEAGQQALIAVLLASSLLNIAYLMPVVVRGFLLPERGKPLAPDPPGEARDAHEAPVRGEAPLLCVLPLAATAIGCVLLFVFADRLYELLQPLAGGP